MITVLLAAELPHRGDGALKTKLLEVWLFYTFTFAIFLERVDHGLLLLLAAELPHRGDGALKRKLLEFGFFTLSLLVTSF